MPWLCFPSRLPTPVQPVAHALPLPPHRHGIGHHGRHRLRHWGLSPGAAATAWRAGVACVWVSAPVAAGGVGWALAPWLPGWGAEAPVASAAIVAVPEPGSLALLGLGVLALAVVRRS